MLCYCMWQLWVCRGRRWRHASLTCLLALCWCAAPRPVRSLSVRRSASRLPWCLPLPEAVLCRVFWVAARDTWRPAENQADGACRSPSPQRVRPRCWVVPGGSLRERSQAACGAVIWRVWTRLVMRPVFRTVHLSTRLWAGSPGIFHVDADGFLLGRRPPRPGPLRVCLCLLFFARAGGRFGAP